MLAYDACATKFNLPARSSPNSKGFQLADCAKKLSFPSFFYFRTAKSAILVQSLKLPRGKFNCSLVTIPHPSGREKGLVNFNEILGLLRHVVCTKLCMECN